MKSILPLVLAGALCASCGGSEAPETATVDTATPGAVEQPSATDAAPADAAPASASFDPCSVITAEQLNQLTARNFGSGTPTANQSNIVGCAFATPDNESSISLLFYIQYADDTYTQYKAMPGMQPVNGLEGAFSSDMLDTFVVRKGERVLVIDWRGFEDAQSWLPQLARQVLDGI